MCCVIIEVSLVMFLFIYIKIIVTIFKVLTRYYKMNIEYLIAKPYKISYMIINKYLLIL